MRTLLGTIAITLLAVGCAGHSPSQPSGPSDGPPLSSLTFAVPATAWNQADAGSYTADTATFGASVRIPTCVANPATRTFCPDIAVEVQARDGRQCLLTASAPLGRDLRPGTYTYNASSPTSTEPGFYLSCNRSGTECGARRGTFTVHEVRSNAAYVATRLHLSFEQTCLFGAIQMPEPGGKAVGELWIVNGTTPAFGWHP